MKLTKRSVESIQPTHRKQVTWDEDLPRFGVSVTPKGLRTYVLDFTAKGRRRRMALGRHGIITAENARRKAIELLAAVQGGADPLETVQSERRAPTVAELAERFLREHVQAKRKPSTWIEYESLLRVHIIPAIGRFKVAELTREQITNLHHEMRAIPAQANRAIAVVSRMFTLAERWGLRPDGTNPCRHVERYREGRRERFLSAREMARLGEVLAKAQREAVEPEAAIAALRLLLLLGARKSEILTLKWQFVDLERRCLRLPESKSGAKVIPLNAPAVEVLAGLAHTRDERAKRNEAVSPWVIAGRHPGKPFVGLHRVWERIRRRAGLEGVRIHDLRHSFASVLAASGTSLIVIGRVLGHTVPATTARYAHLADDPVREAADVAGARIAGALSGEVGAEILPFRREERA
ncbi:MAG TPA: site-specific integrase [Myxococcota bacterium]|nr:site-specific integrase [Myxococcota bacterium]